MFSSSLNIGMTNETEGVRISGIVSPACSSLLYANELHSQDSRILISEDGRRREGLIGVHLDLCRTGGKRQRDWGRLLPRHHRSGRRSIDGNVHDVRVVRRVGRQAEGERNLVRMVMWKADGSVARQPTPFVAGDRAFRRIHTAEGQIALRGTDGIQRHLAIVVARQLSKRIALRPGEYSRLRRVRAAVGKENERHLAAIVKRG